MAECIQLQFHNTEGLLNTPQIMIGRVNITGRHVDL